MLSLLFRRKAVSFRNTLAAFTYWQWAKNAAFITVGFWMLFGLYAAFLRLLRYLDAVPLIGSLLLWKLTAIALMTTFGMVVISSLIISLTTLFYAYDLPFLIKAPLPLRSVFIDKSIESAFFSSWMIGLILFPFILALGRVQGVPWAFYAAFACLIVPFLLFAAVLGMGFTLALMYLFPSPRTRDAIWVLSSFSIAVVYILLRISQPEKLVNPQGLQIVAQYLQFLQAPTARYLPSWWLTVALRSFLAGLWMKFWAAAGLIIAATATAFGLLVMAAERTYGPSYSGAQEGRRSLRPTEIRQRWEDWITERLGITRAIGTLYWKDRASFFRDVTHWSQIVLVGALICVYLFSIQRLPLDQADLKSLASFLNLGIAGFVLSSLGLRFTFPSISAEGKSFWVIRSAPLTTRVLMRAKFLFSLLPMTLISCILIAASNHLLQADRFVSWLSFGTIILMAWTLCGMGVGFGAIFPKFNFSNIHQIESSIGGFAYMAASIAYITLIVAFEALPVKMHFYQLFGHPHAWNRPVAWTCFTAVAALSLAAFSIPWAIGEKSLEKYEI